MKFKEFKLEPFILSIDAGTTGITVLILDKQASICKKYYKELKLKKKKNPIKLKLKKKKNPIKRKNNFN